MSKKKAKKQEPKVWRNLDTPEGRAFWELSPRAKEAMTWPDWMWAGMHDNLQGVPDCDRPVTYCRVL